MNSIPVSLPFYEVILWGEIEPAEVCTEFRERILQKDIERTEVRMHEGVVNLQEERVRGEGEGRGVGGVVGRKYRGGKNAIYVH